MERLSGLETQVAKSTGLVECQDGGCHCGCVKYLLNEYQEVKRSVQELRARTAAGPTSGAGDALLTRIAALERTATAAATLGVPASAASTTFG